LAKGDICKYIGDMSNMSTNEISLLLKANNKGDNYKKIKIKNRFWEYTQICTFQYLGNIFDGFSYF